MKLIRYVLLSVLMLVLVMAVPARTQTIDVSQLPANLNIALCMNDWNRASSMVQQLLASDLTSAASRQQLLMLQGQLEDYRASNARMDQSDACAAAVASGLSGGGNLVPGELPSSRSSSNPSDRATPPNPTIATCNSGYRSANGRCFSNQAALRRHNRSWEEGDRPAMR